LKAATAVRKKECFDFVKSEKKLLEVFSALERAISILEMKQQKNLPRSLKLTLITKCKTFFTLSVWWQMPQHFPSP